MEEKTRYNAAMSMLNIGVAIIALHRTSTWVENEEMYNRFREAYTKDVVKEFPNIERWIAETVGVHTEREAIDNIKSRLEKL